MNNLTKYMRIPMGKAAVHHIFKVAEETKPKIGLNSKG
jgi:hypothetical protein